MQFKVSKFVFVARLFSQLYLDRVSDQNSIIKNEIVSLLKNGAIRQVPFSQNDFYHRLFLVPEKGDGQRPVLDLSAR